MRLDERRAAFLDGEGTLTLAEVREWAHELTTAPPPSAQALPNDTVLMVAVVVSPQRTEDT